MSITPEITINRTQIEDYFNFSFKDLTNDENWRADFIDSKAFVKEIRAKYFTKFIKVTNSEIFKSKNIYVLFRGDSNYYQVFPYKVGQQEGQRGIETHYSYTLKTKANEFVELEFWEYPSLIANVVKINNTKLVETTNDTLLSQFQDWLHKKDSTKKVVNINDEIKLTKFNEKKQDTPLSAKTFSILFSRCNIYKRPI